MNIIDALKKVQEVQSLYCHHCPECPFYLEKYDIYTCFFDRGPDEWAEENIALIAKRFED